MGAPRGVLAPPAVPQPAQPHQQPHPRPTELWLRPALGSGLLDDDPRLLKGGGGDLAEPRATGVQGAAAQDGWRRLFLSKPGAYTKAVRANIRRARERMLDPDDPRIDSAKEFVVEHFPLGGQRTSSYAAYGLAMVFDQMRRIPAEHRGVETLVAEDTVARLLVSFEQAALDRSKLDFARLLSHLPMPP